MKPYDLKSMSVDELCSLHEFVSSALAHRIPTEKARLDQRLRQLGLDDEPHKISHARRPYPQVGFRNLEIPRSRPRLGQAAGKSRAG
jgi:DNA-binding protein H-NS